VQVDFRLISATNRPLDQFVRDSRFREDLYYRVNAFSIRLPSLRERPADIEPLARMFLQNAGAHLGGRNLEIEPDALAAICLYSWPGNIRELRNVIERAALICGQGPIRVAHLPSTVRRTGREVRGTEQGTAISVAAGPSSSRTPVDGETAIDADDAHLLEVLASCGGNQSRAAKELGLSRGALIRRLEKLGVVRPRKPPR
jgi:DNA-binding NtrC family response regulator